MPFINGRYYINPVLGEALEAARAAEEALRQAHAAPGSSASDAPDSTGDSRDARSYNADGGDDDDYAAPKNAPGSSQGPIHRVEIEAAELVPTSTGRAQRGFAARVHRLAAAPRSVAPAPETHVFANHSDLLDFLRDALGHDASQ
jgi:hypothetical protein